MNCRERPLILAIDTSAATTAIAVCEADRLVAEFGIDANRRRSERLWSQIEFLLRECDATVGEVDLFAVSTGPGGFTGIRVGVAAAKGLARAADKPVVGVTSLEALALAGAPEPIVCAMTRSYKGGVYNQVFSFRHGDLPYPLGPAQSSSVADAVARVKEFSSVVIVVGDLIGAPGDGANSVLQDAFNDAVKFKCIKPPRLLAGSIAKIALTRFRAGEAQTASELKAFYVQPAEAEVKLSMGLVGPGLRPSRA